MPVRIFLSLLLMAVLTGGSLLGGSLLSGCRSEGQSKTIRNGSAKVAKEQVTVYFSKSRGSDSVTEGVVRSQAEVATGQSETLEDVRYAVEELLKGPNQEESQQGFYSEIPKGTRLLEVVQKQGSLTINLSNQFTTGGGANSVQQRMKELTKTIFATVADDQKIFVLVDGKPLEIVGGEGLEVKQPLEQAIQ